MVSSFRETPCAWVELFESTLQRYDAILGSDVGSPNPLQQPAGHATPCSEALMLYRRSPAFWTSLRVSRSSSDVEVGLNRDVYPSERRRNRDSGWVTRGMTDDGLSQRGASGEVRKSKHVVV